MKISTFAIALAIIAIGYGLALLCIPSSFLENYGIIVDKYGVLMTREFGAALCQLGIVFWLSRNVSQTDKLWRILLISTVLFTIIIIPFEVIAISSGIVNSMGWTTVALHAIIGLIAASYYFSKSTSAK